MFGRRKNKLSNEQIYSIYKNCEEDLFDTKNFIISQYGMSDTKAQEILENAVFSKIQLRVIYCTECEWNLDRTINKVMGISNYDYETCKRRILKMIEDCDLNSAQFRIERSYESEVENCYKEQKIKDNVVSCPKCGSTSITTTNKKISVVKGAVGAAVGSMVNPVGTVVGAAVGATHSKKIYNVCMNCGHRWKP